MRYTALTVLVGPWHPVGLVNTVRAVYWNLGRWGYQKRDRSPLVRFWRQSARWTPAGRFFAAQQYGVVLLVLENGIILSGLWPHMSSLSFTWQQVSLLLGAGVLGAIGWFAFLSVRRRRYGSYFSTDEIELSVIVSLGGAFPLALASAGKSSGTLIDPFAITFLSVWFLAAGGVSIALLFVRAFIRRSYPCECLDERCHVPVRLTPGEYALATADGRYVLAPGHDVAVQDFVIANTSRYSVVESAMGVDV